MSVFSSLLCMLFVGLVTTVSSLDIGPSLQMKNWMYLKSNTLWRMSLLNMTILGTHDSGAFDLSKQLVPGAQPSWLETVVKTAEKIDIPVNDLISAWAKSQPGDFTQQLNSGVRYIDMRCGWIKSENDWFGFHTETGLQISALMLQIKSFLIENTFEIVIIEASHLDGNPSQNNIIQLIDIFTTTFGSLLVSKTNINGVQRTRLPTYGEMITTKQRVFLTLSDNLADQYNNIWNGNKIWFNTYANSDKLNTMIEFNNNQIATYTKEAVTYYAKNQLFKLSWTLTPAAGTILEGIIPFHPHSLLDLGATADEHLLSWTTSAIQNKMKLGNVILFDNYEKVPIAQMLDLLYP